MSNDFWREQLRKVVTILVWWVVCWLLLLAAILIAKLVDQ